MNPANCLNCGAALAPIQKHCSHCGQKADIHRLSFHDLWHDAIHYFTHADKGIFHLLKGLASRPGRVAQEYIDGKRRMYFKPLNFFLIVAGIVVFMTSTLHRDYPQPSNRPAGSAGVRPSPQQIQVYREMGIRAQKINRITGKYSNVITMMATPLFAGFFWLFYRRQRYNYLEHLVANLYFVPFMMLFYAFVVVPFQRFNSSYSAFMGTLGLFFLFEIVYRSYAYYQFIGKKGAGHFFKALLLSLLASAIWVGGTYSLIRYYIHHGF